MGERGLPQNIRRVGSTCLVFACAVLFSITAIARNPARPTPRPTRPTPSQALAYSEHQYKLGASEPGQAPHLRYMAPYLRVTWQDRHAGSAAQQSVAVAHDVTIDLRYAKFSVWNTGSGAENSIIIDCEEEFFCYVNAGNRREYSHGDIDVTLYTYAARHIARALNYLASVNADRRPKDPFDLPSTVAPESGSGGSDGGQ